MPEAVSSSMIVILLSSVAGLVVLLLGYVIGISRRLARMERWLLESASREEPAPTVAEISAGGAFEAFLSEEPQRRNLPKGEQFAEYRRWRQKNGMNWTNS